MEISICIPTYNQANYLELAIKSALEQTIPILEIIVSNDCSTDNTKEVLDKLSNEIPILRVVHQPNNLGIAENVNACLRLAKGKYIIRLDSDDCLMPNYAEKLSNQLSLFPNAGYAHAAVEEINPSGAKLRIRKLARKSGFQEADVALKEAVKGYKVAANIVMFSKQALEKINYLNSKVNFAEDYYMVTQISAANFGNIYSQEILSKYRVWTDTNKVRQKRKLEEIIGLTKVFNEVLEPVYKLKKWPLIPLFKMRTKLAIKHSDCLGWNIYSSFEKEEIKSVIYKLSSSSKVKIYIWIYVNGFGFIIVSYNKTILFFKRLVKDILFSFQK
jgi:glycosyltransferase involved in cell wall biosynthesis